jgi:2,3-bisphosphoglycerate-independent phosphoglycerate mutase
LGYKTPLQAASTPNLDRLAAGGINGLYHALHPGVALPSEAAHFFMMGYEPRDFPGRAYLEALGAGICFDPEDVLILAHFAIFERSDGRLALIERKPMMPEEDVLGLLQEVSSYAHEDGRISLIRTKGSSGILVVKGAVNPYISDSDPFIPGEPLLEVEPWEERGNDDHARRCARLINSYLIYAHKKLSSHPVNIRRSSQGKPPVNGIVTQRAGKAIALDPLELRWGMRAISLCSISLYAGIFKAMGSSVQLVPEGRDPANDLRSKLEIAMRKLDDYDLIHVHTKAADDAAHTKDPTAKAQVITSLDEGLEHILSELDKRDDLLCVVTGDHATPSWGAMIHSGEPSPITISGPHVWRDPIEAFDEVHCAQGALGHLKGQELMCTLLSFRDQGKLWGLRDSGMNLPYYPGPRRPLKAI